MKFESALVFLSVFQMAMVPALARGITPALPQRGGTPPALAQGVAALSQQNYPRAAQLFEYCLSSTAPTANTTYLCALANLNNNNKTRGEQLLKYLTQAFPNSQEASLAQTTIAKINASSNAARATLSATSSTSSNPQVSSSNTDPEYASLPQTAKFRFTRAEHGHMLVDAYLNGHPIKAWFDTGAYGGFMSTKTLKSAGLSLPTGAANGSTKGWAGKPVPYWNSLMEIRLGDLTRHNTVAVEQSGQEETSILPLIGLDFVKGYTYSIDDQAGWITLTKTGAQSSSYINKTYDVSCVRRNQKEIVPLEVNGKKVDVFIDTGMSNTVLDMETFNRLNLTMPDDAPTRYMTGIGGEFTCREVDVDLNLGPIRKQGFKVLVGGKAGSCIGQDFMQGWRFTVDRDKELMRFFH